MTFVSILMTATEIVKRFDPNIKPNTLYRHPWKNILPNAELIEEAVTRGENPLSVSLVGDVDEDSGRKGRTICHCLRFIYTFPFCRSVCFQRSRY